MIERPTRDQALMSMTLVVSTRSTCARLQVGAIIHRDGRILSTGYNGAPAGVEHCIHTCTCPKVNPVNGKRIIRLAPPHHNDGCPEITPCADTIHAEANAIVFAAKHGISLDQADMMTTHSPCMGCARLIVNAGIMSVVYRDRFRDDVPIDFLNNNDVTCLQLEWN